MNTKNGGRFTILCLVILVSVTLWPDNSGWARNAEAADAVEIVVISSQEEASSPRSSASPLRRVLEAQRLAHSGSAGVPRLIELAGDDDPLVRAHALDALGTIDDSRGIEVLIRHLRTGDWRSRRVAAEALAGRDTPEVRDGLQQALNDPSPFVRLQASRAIDDQNGSFQG